MKLGEIARVSRGVATGNRALFVMTREQAKGRGIEAFVKPLLGGATGFPKEGRPVARDHPDREVIIVASRRDVEDNKALKAYLGDVQPRFASVRPAPIAVTYVGVPRFIANPDGLVITNSLFAVNPRQQMSPKEVLALVERLNAATGKWPKPRFAERYSPRQLEGAEVGS